MNEQPWSIEFYADERRRQPVAEFVENLSQQLQAKVLRDLELLKQAGLSLSMPHARPLAGYGISELRTQSGGEAVRIIYFAVSGRRIVLLHAFLKKTQRTPRNELEIAMRRRQEFVRRMP